MAARKGQRPGLRYLLSADTRLRKLSLKKLAQPGKKPKTAKPTSRARTPASSLADSKRSTRIASPPAMGLATVGLLAAASLFAAGQISDERDEAAAVVTPVSEARLVAAPALMTAGREERTASPVKPRPSSSATRTAATSPAAAIAKPALDAASSESVTITGCLVKSSSGFSLKDASGDAVPKSRSWRSGFFKKGSPRVGVVAASGGVQLSGYVGHRVSATGVLDKGSLRARSVRRIAATCD